MKASKCIAWLVCLFLTQTIWAQPPQQLVQIIVSPNHTDWLYKTNETVTFDIQVFRHGNLLKDVTVDYELGPEFYPTEKKSNVVLKDGKLTLKSKMGTPGFLRCKVIAKVDGREYSGMATAGIEPDKIQPTAVDPSDFDQFWSTAIEEARQTPLDPQVVLLPERCTAELNVYHVSFQNIRPGSRTYGILCVPKKKGKYPALLRVPGAGIRPYNGDIQTASKGVITLEIGIHGIPVTMTQDFYNKLSNGALNHYWEMNRNDRDEIYYKRVFLGCIRAVDYIFTLKEFDGETIGVTGSSQGGTLSFVTAALDKRIKFLAPFHPAMCDHSGHLNKRAGGWPHYFYNREPRQGELETSRYYDVVNFARRLTVPGWYSWGYNDDVCPPTSIHAAYNVITSPKEFYPTFETGHWWYSEQYQIYVNWMWKQLGVK